MSTETTTTTVEVSDTAPVATKTAPKAAKKKKTAPAKKAKTPAKKTPTKKEEKAVRFTKALKVLKLLASSKTVLIKGVSQPGELTYTAIAEQAQVGINNLTAVMSKASEAGAEYPNSLESKGYIKCAQYETTNAKGESIDTPYLFSITAKGRAYWDSVKKNLA